jgi:hypothetical protein
VKRARLVATAACIDTATGTTCPLASLARKPNHTGDHHGGTNFILLETRETTELIGSDKVEGTPVYRSNGEQIGQIERVMIDKISGKVAYAVMSFGGFMGIGQDYYPLPWSLLTYNPGLGGYEVNISEEKLRGAPKYSPHENWDWSDRECGRKVYNYYGQPPYRGS